LRPLCLHGGRRWGRGALTALSPVQRKLASHAAAVLYRDMPVAVVVRIVFWAWFIAAVFAGQQHLLQRLPAPAAQGVLFGLTALLLLAYFGVKPLRDWIDRIDLRSIVLMHASRFVGIYFLMLYQRGELPYAFAVPGGMGDIVVALAAVLIVFLPLGYERRTRFITIWNVVGLTDILLVVFTAVRLNLSAPWSMRALTQLPLCLLPTFLVPLIIATHVVVFVRLARAPGNARP
jgi:hypothetical protein